MSAAIDENLVRRLARLARINLTDDEVRLFAPQLREIVEYFGQLRAVSTDGVTPLAHPLPLANVLRDDVPAPGFDTDQALAQAPERVGDHFRVPVVLDPGAGA
ncbi:MAG: Asp-tRNA(Asn)/Glu-tRNA(Gln) amidotransferase subunit GatC [Phycisphaerae bacterium]